MSTTIILYVAIAVFSLMAIGLYLTVIEFKKFNDDSNK
jgi:hypothetical protein